MKTLRLAGPGASLFYLDLPGPGVPLVFVHGLGCASSCDYPAVAADPALAGRRRLLVDLLGFGYSDRPLGFGYRIADHAACIVELVGALGLGDVDLFGHSMGGPVAIEAAVALGARVRRLVLSEPNLDPGGGTFSTPMAAVSEADYAARLHGEFVAKARARGDDVWAATLAASAPFAAHRGAVSLVEGSEPSWRGKLLALNLPRTVIFGERSLPDPDTVRLAEAGLSVAVVPGAGHGMATEAPSGLAAAITAALV